MEKGTPGNYYDRHGSGPYAAVVTRVRANSRVDVALEGSDMLVQMVPYPAPRPEDKDQYGHFEPVDWYAPQELATAETPEVLTKIRSVIPMKVRAGGWAGWLGLALGLAELALHYLR